MARRTQPLEETQNPNQQNYSAEEKWRADQRRCWERQKAWVGMIEYIRPPTVEAGSEIELGGFVANIGKTPAFNVRGRIGGKSFPKGELFSPIYTDPPEKTPGFFGGVLFPNVRVRLTTRPVRLTQEQMRALRGGTIVRYIFGEILYDDAFKRPHHTTFCLFFPPEFVDDFAEARACDTYNDAT